MHERMYSRTSIIIIPTLDYPNSTVVLFQCACEHLDPPPNHFLGAKFSLATTLTTGLGLD